MELGEIIKSERLKKRLSQKQLGSRVNMSQQMIAQYENGNRKPKLETLHKIATALGVTLNELLDNNWGMFSPEEYANDWKTDNEKTLFKHYNRLNDEGQKKAIEQVEMLTKIEEYKKKDD